MKVFIFSDSWWSIGRVYRDAMKALGYEYRFEDWKGCPHDVFLPNYEWCDRAITNLAGLRYLQGTYPNLDLKKFLLISHGYPEHVNINYDFSLQYGMTSETIRHLFPEGINPFLMPNGVDPDNFHYKPRNGQLTNLGWCGATHVPSKQIQWGHDISNQTQLPLFIANNLTYDEVRDWYNTIDLLLVTSEPIASKESGPLPPFEAIVSGTPVIGTPVGNFRHVPGPKFTTVEEAVNLINHYKDHPQQLQELAKEQYDYVLQNWTYRTLANYWKNALEFS